MSENNTEVKSDWKNRELGALWRREGKNQNFLSGMIRLGDPLGADSVKEIKVVVFTNKGKLKNERAPDFIVYEDRPQEDRPAQDLQPETAPTENSDEVPTGF